LGPGEQAFDLPMLIKNHKTRAGIPARDIYRTWMGNKKEAAADATARVQFMTG
jgi:hypothetical protein